MTTETPQAGDTLSLDDMEMIFEAVKERRDKHPDEPAGLSFFMVFKGIGERFRKIQCTELEYECLRCDFPEDAEMKCPNGHDLYPSTGLSIGWIAIQ